MPYATNGDVRIYYEVVGTGPPLMLVHGMGGDLITWDILGYLDALRPLYQLILLDARGHGHSDKPHDHTDYAPAKRAGDVTAVLDDLSLERCNYFGYSMGAQIGFDVCLFAPDRLNSVVLGGAAPFRLGPPRQLTRADLQPTAERFMHIPFLSSADSQRFAESALRIDVDAHNAIGESSNHRPYDKYREAMASLQCPALVFCGTEDPRFDEAKKMASKMRAAEFVPIDGADHLAAANSKRVLPILLPFLEKYACRVEESS